MGTVVKFPSSFIPYEMRLMHSGGRLAVFGSAMSDTDLSEVPPRVLVVDVTTRRITEDVRLDGVKCGQIQVESQDEQAPCCRIYTPGLAWDLARELLYVVHADEDKVTVVDLAKGDVTRCSEIKPRVSSIGRVVRWLVPAVEAKSVPGTRRRVALSPDGTRLYAVGVRQEITEKRDGEWSSEAVSLGLQVIATEDL